MDKPFDWFIVTVDFSSGDISLSDVASYDSMADVCINSSNPQFSIAAFAEISTATMLPVTPHHIALIDRDLAAVSELGFFLFSVSLAGKESQRSSKKS